MSKDRPQIIIDELNTHVKMPKHPTYAPSFLPDKWQRDAELESYFKAELSRLLDGYTCSMLTENTAAKIQWDVTGLLNSIRIPRINQEWIRFGLKIDAQKIYADNLYTCLMLHGFFDTAMKMAGENEPVDGWEYMGCGHIRNTTKFTTL